MLVVLGILRSEHCLAGSNLPVTVSNLPAFRIRFQFRNALALFWDADIRGQGKWRKDSAWLYPEKNNSYSPISCPIGLTFIQDQIRKSPLFDSFQHLYLGETKKGSLGNPGLWASDHPHSLWVETHFPVTFVSSRLCCFIFNQYLIFRRKDPCLVNNFLN